MRISDWSSDVCSSDLLDAIGDIDELARLGVEHEDPDRLARAIGRGHQYDRLAVAHEAGAQIDIVHLADRRKVHDSALHVVKIEHGLLVRSEEHTSELQSLMRI